VQGIRGGSHDFAHFARCIRRFDQIGDLKVHASEEGLVNGGLDGIDHIGERVALEIKRTATECNATKLSIVGHSNGGLVARFALASLGNMCPGLEMDSFVTFSSPHLGADRLGGSSIFDHAALSQVARAVGSSPLYGKSGQQLMLMDGDGDGDGDGDILAQPLLLQMGTANHFLKGLAQFKQRIAVSNVSHEILVPFCSSALLPPTMYPPTPGPTNTTTHLLDHTTPQQVLLPDTYTGNVFPEAPLGLLASRVLGDLSALGWHRLHADFPSGVLGLSHWWVVGKNMPSEHFGSIAQYVAQLIASPDRTQQ
jgi:hypothetical protein